MEQELGWAAMVLNELLAVLALPEVEANDEPRFQARARFDRFKLPAAIIGTDGLYLANDAWRTTVGMDSPSWAASSLELVRRTGMAVHIDGIPAQRGTSSLAAILAHARVVDPQAVLIVCAEMTAAAIAREIVAPSDALIWSGPVAVAPMADFANDRARLVGIHAAADDWHDELGEGQDARWNRAFGDALRHRTSPEFDLDLQDIDGRPVSYRAHIVMTSSNARWFTVALPGGATKLAADERTRLQQQVVAAQRDAETARRLKEQVLAAVSHELRAPVTTMMLWARVLRDPDADAGARSQAIEAIQQSSAAQAKIVGDLLDVSRAISGKLHVDLRPLDIGRLVGAAVESMLPAALAKRIHLMHEGDRFTGEIQSDAARLRQVLDNLLSNAIKFTPPGGTVKVRIRRKRLVVVIEVEDTGCGIEPDALKVIFEPFRQLEGSLSKAAGGLGLGLAIALQIVELHHGTLVASSEGPGRGTKMTLTLPASGHHRAPSPPAGVAQARSLRDIRVLVVDDDQRVRDALTHLLGRAGARVVPAESASVARERLESDSPQIMVCDIAMPGEDGYTFMRSIRATGNKIPAIALTGYASRADADAALSSGFDMHIAKPIDFEQLVASVTQLVRVQIT
jgi:signal transduction histidine kinase